MLEIGKIIHLSLKIILYLAVSGIFASIIYILGFFFYFLDQKILRWIILVLPIAIIQSAIFGGIVIIIFYLLHVKLVNMSVISYAAFGFFISTVPLLIIVAMPSGGSPEILQIGDNIIVKDGKYTTFGLIYIFTNLIFIGFCGSCAGILFGTMVKKAKINF